MWGRWGWRRGGLIFKLSGINWFGLCGLLVGLTGVGSGVGGDELLEQAEEGELALGGERAASGSSRR